MNHRPTLRALVTAWPEVGILGTLALGLLAVLSGLSACSAGGGGKLQDASVDFSLDFGFPDVLPAGCPPAGPNDKGIGAPCSRGGGQCGGGGKLCTCDTTLGVTPPPGTPCFCTIPIVNVDLTKQPCDTVPAGTCGQNATCCAYQTIAAICVPNACLAGGSCPVF